MREYELLSDEYWRAHGILSDNDPFPVFPHTRQAIHFPRARPLFLHLATGLRKNFWSTSRTEGYNGAGREKKIEKSWGVPPTTEWQKLREEIVVAVGEMAGSLHRKARQIWSSSCRSGTNASSNSNLISMTYGNLFGDADRHPETRREVTFPHFPPFPLQEFSRRLLVFSEARRRTLWPPRNHRPRDCARGVHDFRILRRPQISRAHYYNLKRSGWGRMKPALAIGLCSSPWKLQRIGRREREKVARG